MIQINFAFVQELKCLSVSPGYIYRNDLSKISTIYNIVSVNQQHAMKFDKHTMLSYYLTFV